MKKLSKVLLFIAIVLCISLPLSAAKMMNVTWQWLLNDPYVTSYRYQLDGEADDGWTVVSADTDKYVATGLDPYKDYTLYLQCTYDGTIWSESAKSTAYALLEYVEVPTVEEEPVVEEPAPEPVVEEVTPETADFEVFGYTVNNSWVPGTLTSTSATKGLLSEADVRGFVLYEVEKYGDFLVENVAVEFIPDGFVITYPDTEDAALYLPTYKADIEEYVAKLFAPVEEPVVEEPAPEPVVEEVTPETADFEVFGYTVNNSWVPGTLTSTSATKGLLSEADVRGFVLYEVEKYGDLLMLNTAVEFIPDGFVLTYPETEDVRAYLPTYKADIEEYVAKLFAPVEEPVVEEPAPEPVVEEATPETADFTVFGYTVNNSWIPGTLTSTSATKGLLSEADVRGFVLYEVEKYGDLLMLNTAVEFIPDGFVLTYPETEDAAAYLPTYKADIEEYIAKLFAPVEEPVVEVVEEAPAPEPVAPEAPAEPVAVDVPAPAEVVEVVVSPKAEKLSKYTFKLGASFGADFGINEKVAYTTIFPRLDITADFQNVFAISRVGFGVRLDLTGIFKPVDGTFIGHEFKFFLNGNNWAVDATASAMFMVYGNWDKVQVYAGGGVGYSIGSHLCYPYTHTDDTQIFGFDTAIAFQAVAGIDWKVGEKFTLSFEAYYRNFFQSESKAQNFGASFGMGWKF